MNSLAQVAIHQRQLCAQKTLLDFFPGPRHAIIPSHRADMRTKLLKAPQWCALQTCLFLTLPCSAVQTSEQVRENVGASVQKEYPALFELYKYLHAHPELSSQE